MGLFSVFGRSSNLYFPGCVTYYKNKDNFELYKQIFDRLGIDFRVIDKKVCCGLPALEAGYESDARKLVRRNFEIFKEEGVKSVITNSPCCYKMLIQNYPEIMPDWDIEVKNVWKIILEKLKEKPKLIKHPVSEVITYNDSCYMGRYCNIYSEPREILEIIGYELKEMPNSKENAFCCGSCGGLPITNPKLADKIAHERILEAKRIGVKKMIVSSMEDYTLLKKNTGESGIEVLELSEILADALGIERKNKIADDSRKILELNSSDEDLINNKDETDEEKIKGSGEEEN